MEIIDLLKKEIIILDIESNNKEDILKEMIDRLEEKDFLYNRVKFEEEIFNREKISSTGIGRGIAMPHSKSKYIKESFILFARVDNGIDYKSIDKKLVDIFLLIGIKDDKEADRDHINIVSNISKLLRTDGFIENLRKANNKDRIIELFTYKDSDRILYENKKSDRELILAVTGCPTGIAHTYMAEESLKDYADSIDMDIKIETNGSIGIGNKIDDRDIEKAIGVIIASDIEVDLERFKGLKMIRTSVIEGFRKPDLLIDNILYKDIPIYTGERSKLDTSNRDKLIDNSIVHDLYTNIMNGLSNILPFIMGSGLFFMLSRIISNYYLEDTNIYLFFNNISIYINIIIIPLLSGFIGKSIGDRPGFMPGFVSGILVYRETGFVGGIITGLLSGYIILFLKKITSKIPKELDGLKTMIIYPFFSLLITGLLAIYLVNPIYSNIYTYLIEFLINTRLLGRVIIGSILAIMMCIDMGGPINKISYITTIAILIDTGYGGYMASTMAAGMIPPLSIAISTSLFKNKFSNRERNLARKNYLLGLSFITEGVSYFFKTDKIRVIISSIVGIILTTILIQYWNIELFVAHGGIFIIPLIGDISKILYFVIALGLGSLLSGILYGIMREDRLE